MTVRAQVFVRRLFLVRPHLGLDLSREGAVGFVFAATDYDITSRPPFKDCICFGDFYPADDATQRSLRCLVNPRGCRNGG